MLEVYRIYDSLVTGIRSLSLRPLDVPVSG